MANKPISPAPRTWLDLPHDARKCARLPSIPDTAPIYKDRCDNCRKEFWTRSPKEDICEHCEFVLIDEKHRLRREREAKRGGKLVNPLSSGDNAPAVINPFREGIKL